MSESSKYLYIKGHNTYNMPIQLTAELQRRPNTTKLSGIRLDLCLHYQHKGAYHNEKNKMNMVAMLPL